MEKLTELWLNYRRWILTGLIVIVGLLIGWSQMQTGHSKNGQLMGLDDDKPMANVKKTTQQQTTKAIYVDVKGAVAHPGVIRLRNGDRVEEALKVAQPTDEADLKQVNLAKQLTDQQMLYIPKYGEQGNNVATGNESLDSGSSETKNVNLNTAGKEQLCQITGIGDKKADLILQYRQEHGQFKSVDELKNINGFGDKTVAKLKSQLAV